MENKSNTRWNILKENISFRKLLELDGHITKESGTRISCRCPFHKDKTPSFFLNEKDNHGICFGCDWRGSVIDYEMKAREADFHDAIKNLEKRLPSLQKANAETPKTATKKSDASLAEAHKNERNEYSDRLATDEAIRKTICEKRIGAGNKWSPDTIQKLAKEGSLGWAGDALSFHYPTGTKYRQWPDRKFIWDENNVGISLWRQERISAAEHIYLTEGETDAISLLDAGAESKPGNAVVSIQGASSFDPAWAEYFRDKVVTLCFDNDEAGAAAAERVGGLLHEVAADVFVLVRRHARMVG
ncbi:MAG: dnaG [Chthoniobacteraceae bacterium]|nr:dnaG [Chthoniobacteraceae bacterium]